MTKLEKIKLIKKESNKLAKRCRKKFEKFEKEVLSQIMEEDFTEPEIKMIMAKLEWETLFLGTAIYVRVYRRLMGKRLKY